MLGAFHCIVPALAHRSYFASINIWFKMRIVLSLRPDMLRALPETNSETCEISGTQCCCFRYCRAHDGDSKQVRLKLHEHVVHCGSAIDAQLAEFVVRLRVHCVDHIGDLKSNAFERRVRNMSWLRAATQSDEQAAGVRVPVWRAEAHECGHKNDAVRVFYCLRKRLDVRRCANQF